MIECSNAIKCPSVNYHLAGSKKIQQELSQPGVLEKFIPDPQKAQRLRKTFAKQYSLEMVNTSVFFFQIFPLYESFLQMHTQAQGSAIYSANILIFTNI